MIVVIQAMIVVIHWAIVVIQACIVVIYWGIIVIHINIVVNKKDRDFHHDLHLRFMD
ncbi:hypothetical protein H9650_18035 [Psychrobacillus sp. Sa2BUA9]|uniref:Uncharacterized protein n=1 Tax=Psychrobacillus faecigallinarum TaxID=2762235 RepID=A0ABR8RE01_9BACI|nr:MULTISPECIES: hypothetical protein [Psychrobacillus]MBD7946007.1 hypothetical protein [Psychrobacillus faecigallinarum]QGM28914.1 hypothetical protein GI482_00115 [Bacillus sp. N3536]